MLDSPASMSIHEEATVVAERPVMGVFNNLVMFANGAEIPRGSSRLHAHRSRDRHGR
jgi:hypothetical protein